MKFTFGKYWNADLNDIDDMRVRAGGTILSGLWLLLFIGSIFGVWSFFGGPYFYLFSVPLALLIGISLVLVLFIPRVIWNLIRAVGQLFYPKMSTPLPPTLDDVRFNTALNESPPTQDANTTPEDVSAVPSGQNSQRKTMLVNPQLRTSWLTRSDGQMADIRYHCANCQSHPEVAIRVLAPEKNRPRIHTGGPFPVGAICPNCRRILGQWSSKSALESQVRQMANS